MKKYFSAALAAAMCMTMAVTSFAAEAPAPVKTSAGNSIVAPLDLDLAGGDVKNATDWEKTIKLSKSNGSTVNFYIENKGSVSITISINGENARSLAPGEKGHITANVTGLVSKNYKFKAVPTSSGEITFRYDIAQRD